MDYHEKINKFFKHSNNGHINFWKYLENEINNDNFYLPIAIENNEILGYAIAKIDYYPPVFDNTIYCYLTDIVIKEKSRWKEIGNQLFDKLIEWCKSKGINRIELQYLPENKLAYEFYKNIGFKTHLETLCYSF